MDWMVDYANVHHDAFKLLLCCSEGTKYENMVHEMVKNRDCGNTRFCKSYGRDWDASLHH